MEKMKTHGRTTGFRGHEKEFECYSKCIGNLGMV